MPNPQLIRPLVRELRAYVPGEQPKIKGLIKLNTNENPYPPSPKVLAAVKAAVDGRLRLYPNPTAERLREKLAKLHGGRPENIVAGNGSDELLALAVRGFAEPVLKSRVRSPRSLVQYFTPSYSLYPVLADIHGAVKNALPLNPDFGLPTLRELKLGKVWDFRAALTFVTTPNAPSGRGYPTRELDALCRAHKGVVVLDEAYVDFAEENAMALALKYPHVLVARNILEGVFAVLPARRLFCRPSGTHRRAAQDSGQLQRERPWPDCRRSHAGRFAVLPGKFQKNHRHARAS